MKNFIKFMKLSKLKFSTAL